MPIEMGDGGYVQQACVYQDIHPLKQPHVAVFLECGDKALSLIGWLWELGIPEQELGGDQLPVDLIVLNQEFVDVE